MTVVNNYYNTTVINKNVTHNVTYVNQRVGRQRYRDVRTKLQAPGLSTDGAATPDFALINAKYGNRTGCRRSSSRRTAQAGDFAPGGGVATRYQPPRCRSRARAGCRAKTPPPPAPLPFAQRQEAIKANNGQPIFDCMSPADCKRSNPTTTPRRRCGSHRPQEWPRLLSRGTLSLETRSPETGACSRTIIARQARTPIRTRMRPETTTQTPT